MKIGYYPGCSLSGTGREYDISLKKVVELLGVDLEELNDWSCCGATSAHATDHFLSAALPARNLVLAKKQQLGELFAPCAACYNRLLVSRHEIVNDPEFGRLIAAQTDGEIDESVSIINIIELFERIGNEKILENKKTDLKGIKAACYYGCLLVRPFSITRFDDAEQPESMEALIALTGAEAIKWNFKVECCGGAHSIAHKEIVVDLSKKIIDNARLHGADVIVVACPMCHSNLDMRQKAIKKINPYHEEMPILYLSELIGLSLGLDEKELGLNLHFIPCGSLMDKVVSREQ